MILLRCERRRAKRFQPVELRLALLFEELRIEINVIFPFVGDIGIGINGLDRTGREAGTAIDACLRIDIILIRFDGGVDTIDRTDVDARRVLRSNARFGNHIAHDAVRD